MTRRLDAKKRFAEGQIICVLRMTEAGMLIKDPCRRHDFGQASCYLWRSKFRDIDVSDTNRLCHLRRDP
jgi:putative transposase